MNWKARNEVNKKSIFEHTLSVSLSLKSSELKKIGSEIESHHKDAVDVKLY